MPTAVTLSRSELEAYWMPFTANRQFKSKPRLLAIVENFEGWERGADWN